MKTSLALANLVHQKVRTVVAICGVAFALILIFMQLGFYGAAESTATMLYEHLDFDLVLVSSEYVEINQASTFSPRRLSQVEAHPDVVRVVPLHIGYQLWRSLEQDGPQAQRRRPLLVVAFQPREPIFKQPEIEQNLTLLQQPDTVLMDRRTRREFGPQVGPGGRPIRAEVGTRKIAVVGRFTLGTGFGANGLLLTSEQTFSRMLGGRPVDRVSVGLVKLRDGASVRQVARELKQLLPQDVRVRTRNEIESRERRYWVSNTVVGIIFVFGVIVALIVGVVFVYQVISSDIANRLGEYATLKAMGYSKGHLSGVVLQQALLLAGFGYLLGLAVSLGLYAWTRQVAVIPIGMPLWRALGVLALAVAMCSFSGLLALRKVRAADPADLF